MKKLVALLVLSLLAFSGAAFGADANHTPITPVTPENPVVVVPPAVEETIVTLKTLIQELLAAIVDLAKTLTTTTATVAQDQQNLAASQGIDTTARNDKAATLAAGTGKEVKTPSADTVTIGANKTQQEQETKARGFAQNNKLMAADMPKITPKEPGIYPISVPTFDPAYHGKKIGWNAGRPGRLLSLSALTDTDGAVFLDSNNNETDIVPDGTTPAGATAGVISVLANMEANVEYDPAITVDLSEIDETDTAFAKIVDTFKAVVSATDDGTIVISTFVSSDILESLGSPSLFPASKIDGTVSVNSTKAKSDGKAGAMGLFNLKAPDAGKYALQVNFGGLNNASADKSSLALDLNGTYVTTSSVVEVAAEGGATFYTLSNGKAIETKTLPSGEGYVVFSVENKNYSPVLTVDLAEEKKSGSSSSSGCDAGFFGLAGLALVALLKKKA